MGDGGGGPLISSDGAAPSQMVSVSASVIFPCTIKFQKISFGTGLCGWSRKKGVCVFVCDDDVSIVVNDKGKIKVTVSDDDSNCIHICKPPHRSSVDNI